KTLLPFISAFALLASSALVSFFYTSGHFDVFWILGHIIEIVGYVALAIWVWQYLKLRVREMLLLIFFSASLLVSIVVTLAFSMILIRQIELAMMNNLSANIKLADYLIIHLKEESLSKARIFSSTVELRNALSKNDFGKIERLANNFAEQENISLLTIADKTGNVILRANQTTEKGDNMIVGKSGQLAAEGYSVATVDSFAGEKFAVKAISPVISPNGAVMGYVIAGFILDNPFVDSLKKITGLDVSIYDKDKVAASTITGLDDRTRISGTNLSNSFIETTVLKGGKAVTLNNDIVSKPFVSSYIPINDLDGGVVGMVSFAKSQREIFEIANTTNILTLISVIIIMAILAAPIFKFSRRLLE
ncbi:MAG TPA: cache domain-containing protein, partial [Candidatus Paceibacterota bacterium]|nr:cache domain-containing protein [Candidatus Paceibacterota bacterium]